MTCIWASSIRTITGVVVDVARVKGGEAVFPHVEREVIYAPLRRTKDGDFVEADYPFYFDGKEVPPLRAGPVAAGHGGIVAEISADDLDGQVHE